ncbi:MAG TPA: flavin reductase family protein [Flavobacteriaceae bacterium]|nr:flavin reductase family protein [Flavobacteriaceae bacterium]
MKTLDAKSISARELYANLTGAVSPRPIALVSSVDTEGVVNLAPFSFFNLFSAQPPTVIFSCVDSLRNGSSKDTLYNALETKEVVINMVNYNMVQQTSLSSTAYAKGVNEFIKAGFTPLESLEVKPPRVEESPIQLECKVEEVIKLGEENGAGNLVVCRVLKMHINKEVLDENEVIDPYKLDIVSRLGGNYYGRAREGLFEVTKPTTNLGIGVDALPESIRNSSVLTGNDLGKLGNIEQFPEAEIIEAYVADKSELQELFKSNDVERLHRYAQDLLQDDEVEAAWCVLLGKVKEII